MTSVTTAFEGFLKNVRLPEALADQCRGEHLRLRGRLLADAVVRALVG